MSTWHLRNANGRLPNIRTIRRPHGESDHFEAVVGSGDSLCGPIVVRLDFGYGSKADEANARLIAAAPEMRESLGEVAVLLRSSLRDFAEEPWAVRVFELIDRVDGAQR